ncbi:ribonuclease P protein subunit p38 [Diachasma alloeum]|uniref:ribonuclease P protein subunit p38 n=1 Tax=Diachasma alloeum TaxID=454923 RepID=UPI000738212B|nr:ribonuclease P protein subunit p38 [Diachasma alloeum]
MGTPKNAKNLKTPLSTIKKGLVKGLRNILAHPHEFCWPVVRDERGEDLKNILNESLPNRTGHPREISWAQLRKMSKEERAALKKEMKSKKMENKEDEINNKMCLGVNAVTRALERDSLASVLVDSNVEPLIMIKHVVTMCQNKNLPVILVPFLKSSTSQRLGFASAALGLRKSWIEDRTSDFYKLHANISSLAEELPKTKNPMQLFDDDDDDDDEEKIPLETKNQPTAIFKLSTSVYLHRKSVNERAFVPPEPQKPPKNPEKVSDEFISLGDDVDMEEFNEKAAEISKRERYIDIHEPKPKKLKKNPGRFENEMKSHKSKDAIKRDETIYCPLKVKRVQGNSQRLKATKTPKMKKKSSAGKK